MLSMLTVLLSAQPVTEDCNNGIDDDGNGFIDLNDTACICKGIKDTLFVPSSLIPNPSFEEYYCCPTGLMQLNCSKYWIQASPATSDYFHTCGFRQDPMRGSPPLPLPAGNGYVGFLDLYTHPVRNAIYKEYVGACLNSPMLAGREYTLSFWIGFGQRGNAYGPRAITTLGIFGTGQCTNLPFGDANSWLCPSNYPNWFEITRVTASGTNKWVKVNLKITPTTNIEAIAIGPQCTRADGYYYYFLDELLLEETVKFDSLLLAITGNPCRDSIVLNSPASTVTRIKYQWYKDGVAIPSANLSNYLIPRGQEGRYVLKAIDGNDCELSNSYEYNLDTTYASLKTSICKGDSLVIDGQVFNTQGDYAVLLKNTKGCDSILDLNLTVHTPRDSSFSAAICEGNSLQFNGVRYDKTGSYNWFDKDTNGCDSSTILNLTVLPNKFTQWDTFICEGQSLKAGNQIYTSPGFYTQTFLSADGCDSTLVVDLKVGANTNAVVDTSICKGKTLSLNGNNYTTSGTYLMQLNNAAGCDSLITLNLSVNPVYNISLDSSRCEGDTLYFGQMKFFRSGIYPIPFVSHLGCDSLITLNYFSKPKSASRLDTTLCFDQSIHIAGVHYRDSGTYQQFYLSANGCDSILTLHIEKTLRPTLLSQIEDVRCHGQQSGSIQISVQGTTAPYQYNWENGSSLNIRQNLSRGLYYVSITDRHQCTIRDSFLIAEPDPLLFDILVKHANCKSPESGTVFVDFAEGGVEPYLFKIDGVAHDFTDGKEGVSPGSHIIEFTDANGCNQFKSFTILDPVIGAVDVNPDSLRIVIGDSVYLIAEVNALDSIVEIEWSGPGIIRCQNCLATSVIPGPKGGVFHVKITDSFGCIYTASIFIAAEQKYFAPNVFSPNGDNINDFFNIITDRSVDVIDVLKIFDRWGNLQFEGKKFSPHRTQDGWNGEFKGIKSLPGVYVYVFQFHDKAGIFHQLSGDVTLIR